MERVHRFVAVVAIAFLAACGGGGGGGGDVAPALSSAGASANLNLTLPTSAPAPGLTAAPFAYMSAGTAPGSFQGAIAASASTGIIINVSGDIVTDNNGTNANLSPGSVAVKVGTSATTFAHSGAREVPAAGRSTPQSAGVSAPLTDRLDDPAIEREIVALSRSAQRTTRRGGLGLRRPQGLGTTIGSIASFTVNTNAIGTNGAGQTTTVPAGLVAVSNHGYIWVDSTLTMSTATAAAIGNDFDIAYASDTTHFGTPEYTSAAPEAQLSRTPCDASGNSIAGASPVPLIIPPPNGMHVVLIVSEHTLGSGVGGYFSSTNFFTQAIANCISGHPASNEASMIVIGYDPLQQTAFETQEALARGTAHEFAHLINFVNHTVLSQTPATEDRYINEGLSVLAQDFALSAQFPQLTNDVDFMQPVVADFFTSPSHFSLTGFTGVDPNATAFAFNCLGCYGQAYLFQRYLYDRFGGDAYTHAMESGGGVGMTNLQAATGITLTQAISDFAVALAASGHGVVTDPRYNFVHFHPVGIFFDQFGNSVSLQGPFMFAATPGTTDTLTPYLGTFFYVQVQAARGAGAGITVTDTSGNFALTSGLLQF